MRQSNVSYCVARCSRNVWKDGKWCCAVNRRHTSSVLAGNRRSSSGRWPRLEWNRLASSDDNNSRSSSGSGRDDDDDDGVNDDSVDDAVEPAEEHSTGRDLLEEDLG